MTKNLLKTHHHYGQELLLRWQRCTFVTPVDQPESATLRTDLR